MNYFAKKRLRVNRFLCWLGKFMLKICGWKVEGKLPESRKSVVVIAHHTSNWDFPVGLMASFALKAEPYWLGKEALFRWPMGGLFRWLGGIPVDRSATHNVVEQVAEAFQGKDKLMLVIAPEGTRRRVESWRSGFYYIARRAKVPIDCAFIDYRRKAVGFGPSITPTDDLTGVMQKIREFYDGVTPLYPEKAGVVKIVPKDPEDQ